MLITYKYRLKDRSSRKRLHKHAYAVNQVWNWCVAQHLDAQERYVAGAKKRRWLSFFDLTKLFGGIGREIGLSQLSVACTCRGFVKDRNAIRHAPKYRQSFGRNKALGWIPFDSNNRRVYGNSIIFCKNRYRWFGNKRRPLPKNVKGGYFVEDALGRWWVCFHVEASIIDNKAPTGEIGIDLGLKTLATLSDGTKIENLRHTKTWAHRLATAQRARKQRRIKAIHTRIANARKDHLHKVSTELAARYALIAVGNVSAKKLARTRLAKSMYDASWSTFRRFLSYKSQGYVEVDERFTTQTCSECGSIAGPKGYAGLNKREWICSDCGANHDRDINSARNILSLGRSAAPPVEESWSIAA